MRSETSFTPRSLAVVGLGYAGCVTAACLSRLGHQVIGVDRDELKVDAVNAKRAPFHEPGLTELVAEGVGAGRLQATADLACAVSVADIVLVCVGTPAEKNGNVSLQQLRRVCEELAAALRRRTRDLIVGIRSTVAPGTCDQVIAPLLGRDGRVAVLHHPEFLREGSAVCDFLEPGLLVIGGTEGWAVRELAALYAPLGVEPCFVSIRAAEMIKYACNSYHALKIAFANEVGALCERMDIPSHEVMNAFCRDHRLNISSAYLKPGFAFGGSCLPKDLRVLTFRARCLDLELPLLESLLPANAAHLQRAIDAVMDYPSHRIAIFGLAFKQNTDDLRDSPVIPLIEYLIGKGREVRVFDPQITPARIYGTNREFILTAIPQIERLMVASFEELVDWCDCLVVAQPPQREMSVALAAVRRPLLDLVGAFPSNLDTGTAAA